MNIPIIKFIDYYLGIPLCFLLGLLYSIKDKIWLRSNTNRALNKILLIKTWGLGNIIIMLPVLKAIRAKFPRARIVFLTLKGNRGIMEHNPFIDSFYLLDLGNPLHFLFNSARLMHKIRSERFDCVLDFDQFARFSALICLFSKAPLRLGYDTLSQGKKWAFNLPVKYNNNQHTVCVFTDLVKKIGIHHLNLSPIPINILTHDKNVVNAFLSGHRLDSSQVLIAMHLGSGDNFPQRRWPTENFIEIAKRLIEHYGAKILLTGNSEEEHNLNKYFCTIIKKDVFNTCRQFNVREIAYLIKECRLLFSADTAPLHMATAMGTPTICFFGPNTPLLYGPRRATDTIFYHSVPCSPCLTNFNSKTSKCRNPICITGITVDEVWNKVKSYFN